MSCQHFPSVDKSSCFQSRDGITFQKVIVGKLCMAESSWMHALVFMCIITTSAVQKPHRHHRQWPRTYFVSIQSREMMLPHNCLLLAKKCLQRNSSSPWPRLIENGKISTTNEKSQQAPRATHPSTLKNSSNLLGMRTYGKPLYWQECTSSFFFLDIIMVARTCYWLTLHVPLFAHNSS